MTNSPNNTPTVYVVDDDLPMRESLVRLIEAMGFVAQGFESASAFHDVYQRGWPGCLLLDVRMPRQSGLQLYEQLLLEEKRLPVIFITAHADVTTAVAAMKTGAVEFLEKPFDHETLLRLIQKAIVLDNQWRQRETEFAAVNVRIARLNQRDKETLNLILVGESNKAMAAKLFISERAVEMRRAVIMRKLEVSSLAELLAVAITHRVMAEVDSLKAATSLR